MSSATWPYAEQVSDEIPTAGFCLVQGQMNGIPVPKSAWATPGHYSVVAFLPEDHTYAKGSLFILAPGTKCIVFDMDGECAIPSHKPVLHSSTACTSQGMRAVGRVFAKQLWQQCS